MGSGRERRYVLYSVGGEQGTDSFLPAGRGDRWLLGTRGVDLDQEEIARRIRVGAGVPSLPLRIERIGHFSFAAQMAECFREGDAFLVGDAAHRVTPRGGTGMNTAIADGYDLGWKLAWVLNGWESERLLDTYEIERRPVAEHNVARSADENGSVRTPEEGLRVDLGDRIPHAWQGGARPSTWSGRGSRCSPARARSRDVAGADGGPPRLVRRLDEHGARVLGIAHGEGLLVRPDGVPVGRCGQESIGVQGKALGPPSAAAI